MSTAILRDKSFGNVLKTLQSPYIRNGAHTIDIEDVMNTSSYAIKTSDGFAAFIKAVRLFVQRCIFFNHESHRLRYGEEEVCEPVTEERLDALYSIGEVVSKEQLFMTLHCIDYNSGIKEQERPIRCRQPTTSGTSSWRSSYRAVLLLSLGSRRTRRIVNGFEHLIAVQKFNSKYINSKFKSYDNKSYRYATA